jgi:hypothetical protein
LEAAIEENQRSQEQFQKLLQDSLVQNDEVVDGGKSNIEGRRRALREVGNFVADKLFKLKRALQEVQEQSVLVEQQIAENDTRRAELEAALGDSRRSGFVSTGTQVDREPETIARAANRAGQEPGCAGNVGRPTHRHATRVGQTASHVRPSAKLRWSQKRRSCNPARPTTSDGSRR